MSRSVPPGPTMLAARISFSSSQGDPALSLADRDCAADEVRDVHAALAIYDLTDRERAHHDEQARRDTILPSSSAMTG
ncbi:hypothetical protein [Bradyrhizobium sp. HKCCYLS20291]|uniref:hypothetical protein n=1 Tax=Bradyrhizobium sp. HKCCYLS20291 TaxID=3420766 RepID=UPI003EB70B54